MKGVVKSLEKTVSKIHISDNIDAFWESDRSWELSVSVSPVVLDTLHVPLVDQDNNFLFRALINLSEKVIVSLINENTLEFWEENGEGLNVPVDEIWVQALLCELRWLRVVHSRNGLRSLHSPELVSGHAQSSPEVTCEVHPLLMIKSMPGILIKFSSKEISLSSNFLSFFQGKFSLETWRKESEVLWEFEMHFEHKAVSVKFEPE